MLEKINYDFIGLRKNAPIVRAIYFDALSEPQSEKLVNKDERPNRRISQKVKDLVWRRDEGKYVVCGSVENLEFDHIIPHSKGGVNRYRNVQLLCESCNKRKSAKIG